MSLSPPPVEKPPTVVELNWEHDLVFSGSSAGVTMTLDSGSREGPSPMQALAFGLAGCMAMDVVQILKKARQDIRGLRADLIGVRAPGEPRRFTSFDLRYTLTGPVDPEHANRAIQLSRDKYCSVWHSLRQDIPLTVTVTVVPGY
jgi:putative redox protein